MEWTKLFDSATVMGIVRHVLTFFGGWLVASGAFDAGAVDQLVGAAVTIVGLLWSAWDKKGVAAKVEAAKASALADFKPRPDIGG